MRSFPVCVESFSKPISAAMPSDCWPHGVVTSDDNDKFLRLLFGAANREDLTDSLPQWSWDQTHGRFSDSPCFLTLVNVEELPELLRLGHTFGIFADQRNWEMQNCGTMSSVSDRIHDIQGTSKATRYYRQATINGQNRDCRTSFGGDDKWKKATCPRAAKAHIHGQMFENSLNQNMSQNWKKFFPESKDNKVVVPHSRGKRRWTKVW